MKKLIETPEAESYSPETRSAVVALVGLQLLFEWRYWAILLPFMIAGFAAFGLVERMGLPFLGRIGVTLAIVLPGALLWTVVAWRLQRWALSQRREKLLHAVAGQHPGTPISDTNSPVDHAQAVENDQRRFEATRCGHADWISHAELEAAFQALEMPEGWTNEPEPNKAEIYFTKFRQWREEMYRRHAATLGASERNSLETGSHPSQSHRRQPEARAYAEDLMADLRRRGVDFVNEVRIGSYHGDRLVLSLVVEAGVKERVVLSSIPCYYRGFDVRWHRENQASEPAADSNNPQAL